MLNPLSATAIFLTETIFNLLIWLLLLRFLLQTVQANFYNPLSQVIVKLTSFLSPIRKLFPKLRRFDLAALAIAGLIIGLKWVFLAWLQASALPTFSAIAFIASAELIKQIINILFYALLISVFLSWVQAQGAQPLAQLTAQLTEPFIKPIRKRIPLIAGIDISPLVMLILLQMFSILFIQSLMNMAQVLA